MKSKKVKQYILKFGVIALVGMFGTHIAAAQTCDVTWRKADNPRTISGTQTIPVGQTVCAEPGVRVQFATNGKLELRGQLRAIGAANDRIIFTGANVFPNRVEVVGSLDLQFADISVPFNVNPGSSMTCRDCNFSARGGIFTLGGVVFSYTPTFISVENSLFDSNEELNSDNAAFYVSDATIILRNTVFRNAAFCDIGKSNLYIDAVTSQNARFDGIKISQDIWQPQFLNNLSITGAADIGLSLELGNFEIGENVTIQNNEFPIKANGGLLPGSNVPATGNLNNWIEIGGFQAYSVYAPFQIPYVASGARISLTEILPGAVIKLRPEVKIDTFGNPHVEVLGLPNAPVTFEPFAAGQKWNGLELFQTGDRMEYTVLDGSRLGAYSSTASDTSIYFDQMVFRNHDVALNDQDGDLVYVQGSLFNNNAIAVRSDGNGSTYRMSGETNPNLFENNTIGVRSINGAITDVRFNWWNSPTGPTTPLNPGGTGDRIEGNPMFQPFRTARPDRADHPPVVRMQRRPFELSAGSFEGVIEPGQKVILRWDAFDNNTIVRQKVLLALNGNAKEMFTVLYDNLPGNQRSIEFTMPQSAGTSGGFNKFIRIVAIDDKGQEGWDELGIQVPSGTEPGVLQITTPLAGQTFRSGSEFNINWTITTPFNDPTFQVFLILDGDRKIDFQANGNSNGAFSTIKLPYISTDSARIAVKSQGSINNVKWFYSQPFAIRPDARYPDAPPQISVSSPNAGQTFPAGGIVPVSWTASDDEALRSFSILYSTDGGRTWLTEVENLPPTATNYNWRTPLGTGFNDVRVRVVAFDRRFQNSSDGYSRSFTITANQTALRNTQFDFDGDGRADVSVFRPSNGAWYLNQSTNGFTGVTFGFGTDKLAPADYDGDGKTDVAVFRDGSWYYLKSSNNSFVGLQWGQTGDIPLPTDFDGDGKADINVFRPSNGAWYRLNSSNGQFFGTLFGQNGDKPLIADFDGDGKSDIMVFRPSTGSFYSLDSLTGNFRGVAFGFGTDIPTLGDYDGDGKTDAAVFRPSNGAWYRLNSSNGQFFGTLFGQTGDVPTAADYDGDGKTDIAVFRNGDWYYLKSSNGAFVGMTYGFGTDKPIPAAFVQ